MSREKQIEEMIERVRMNTEACQTCTLYKERLCDYNCDLCEDIQAACEALYTAGYRKQEWISVDERLPEENTRVLVYLDETLYDYTHIDTDRIKRGNWIRWGKAVTHWMPLPEAPKMKGGAE